MNAANELRLEIARENAGRFRQDPRVVAILLTGSVAAGCADDASDIDCTITLERPFTDEEFQAAVEEAKATGGGLHGGSAAEGFALYHYVRGIKCDFGFDTVAQLETLFSGLLEKPHLEADAHIIASGTVKGIALHGEPLIRDWQRRLADFPPALADLIVEHHLRFMPRWALETMGVARGEVLFVNETVLAAVKNLVGILCGLNRRYLPGKVKGIGWEIAQMKLTPEDLQRRLERLFLVQPREAVEQLSGLIEETLALVAEHMPHIDQSRVRRVWGMVLRK